MRPCLFLDRDGVIIKNVPYSNDPESVVLLEGITALIQKAKALDYRVICITNQSGIGRGWVKLESYYAITAKMEQFLAKENCQLDAVYFAPYYEKATDSQWLAKPEWRKPNPGMIEQACRDFQIDLTKSIVVGDRASDIEAGFRGKVQRRILVSSVDFPDEILAVPHGIEFQVVQKISEIVL